MESKLLTVAEIGKRYAVGPKKVLHWIRSGELKAINVGHGQQQPRWRITPEAIEEFELMRTYTPTNPTKKRRKQSSDDEVIRLY